MEQLPHQRNKQSSSHFVPNALNFVLIIGIVNLFADLTYEGGASINGQFLATLGTAAVAVSIISGLGEFLGYALRPLAGYLTDKTGKYWLVAFVGYAVNLLAVPAMVLANTWQLAAIFILLERIGRAIRKPSVDVMLSYTTGQLGRGWVYALNTALDETGATLGPLVMTVILFFHGSYRTGYLYLLISSILAIGALTIARLYFPKPTNLEKTAVVTGTAFSQAYWIYMAAATCLALGLVSYELVPFHLAITHAVSIQLIPLLLAFSTGFGVIANLVLGRWFDKATLPTVLGAVFISSLFAPLVFSGGGIWTIGVAMMVWGVSYAMQDTLLNALVAGMLPQGKRNLAFGLFYAGFGGGILIGSIVTGWLYTYSLGLTAGFSMGMQLLSLPLFWWAYRASKITES